MRERREEKKKTRQILDIAPQIWENGLINPFSLFFCEDSMEDDKRLHFTPPPVIVQARPKDAIDYVIDSLVILSLISFIVYNVYEITLRRKLL